MWVGPWGFFRFHLLAEDAATVDIMSNGRFDLGIGKGYRVNEFEGFGIPREERNAQLEEGLEENEMDIPVVGLTEMLAEHLVEKAS